MKGIYWGVVVVLVIIIAWAFMAYRARKAEGPCGSGYAVAAGPGVWASQGYGSCPNTLVPGNCILPLAAAKAACQKSPSQCSGLILPSTAAGYQAWTASSGGNQSLAGTAQLNPTGYAPAQHFPKYAGVYCVQKGS